MSNAGTNHQLHFFYLLLLATFISILLTNPFLRFPYDIWWQLMTIDDIYRFHKIPSIRRLWFYFWANFFIFFSIHDFFMRAKIIHVIQTTISLSAVFIFSKVLMRNLFEKIPKITLNYLSYWAMITWLTIYATFSMYYHHVWIMWYSVSYQITLAFFWYCTALTLIVFFERKSWPIKVFYTIQILFFCTMMLLIHPMELAYYFLYLLLVLALFPDTFLGFLKNKFLIIAPAILIVSGAIYYIFKTYYIHRDKVPPFFQLLKNGGWSLVYNKVINNGQVLINGANRAAASINELMIVILVVAILIFADFIRRKFLHQNTDLNCRFFLLTIIFASLVCIPLVKLTAGIASVIFSLSVVNRIYYCSSLYVILPIGVYYFWNLFEE